MKLQAEGNTSKTRDWGWIEVDGVQRVVCYPSTKSNCYVVPLNMDGSYGLLMAKETSAFHDETLARATKEINAVLTRIVRDNSNPERHLNFIQASSGLLLAWCSEVVERSEEIA